MAFKIGDNDELTVFDLLGMVSGTVTQDKHHFFNKVSSKGGGDGDSADDIVSQIAGNLPKVLKGARIPMNKVANNPALASPSVTAMKYFGGSPLFKVAIDQIMPKKIQVFGSATMGAGFNAMNFQTNPLFSGEDSLQNVVGKILFGSNVSAISSEAHQMFNPLKELATVVGKAGGADAQTKLNPASDTSRLIQMAAAGFAGGKNPFSGSALSDGMDVAKEVQAYLKKLS